MVFSLLVLCGPARALYEDTGIYTPVDDSGDTGDTSDSGDSLYNLASDAR